LRTRSWNCLASWTEPVEGRDQPFDRLLGFQFRSRVLTRIGDGNVVDGRHIVLAAPFHLPVQVQQLEPKHLKGQRDQFGQLGDVTVFFVQHEHDALDKVFRRLPR
jgi:hypothetical protein